ncbi:hypothetical protein BJ508DRAFT_412433 [Ascobolus immersus RN42]|uniref:Nitrogen permease regulator 3 n=1 Tax=Ascobolus immersus RN42 TaxID=1160509 RepID=A0A3N4IFS8_ASCIM|nr:hypothetical protein BJ508DRAFT_412433 [Ascobolus immersus RN42]
MSAPSTHQPKIRLLPHPNPFLPGRSSSTFNPNILPDSIPPISLPDDYDLHPPPPPKSLHTHLPNPSLICILLLIRSASGPQVVFHYPGGYKYTTGEDTDDGIDGDSDNAEGNDDGTSGSSSTSSDGSSGSSDEGEGGGEGGRGRGSVSGKGSTIKTATRGSDRYGTGTGTGTGLYGRSGRRGRVDSDHETSESGDSSSPTRPGSSSGLLPHSSGRGQSGGKGGGKEWDSCLGIDCASLAGILAPTKDALLRRKFELGVNDWAWCGYPIGLLPGGKWRRSEEEKEVKVVLVDDENRRVDPEDLGKDEMEDLMRRMEEELGMEEEEEEVDGEGLTEEGEKQPPPPPPPVEKEKKRKNPMTMFHVVFVLNPPILEHQQRVEQMFVNVVKPFSKALKWEQDRANYVWKESSKILQLKDKAAQNGTSFEKLWTQILESSDLARNMKVLYESISKSEIADINLNNNTRLSIQIPQLLQIPFLPTLSDPQMPGIPLSCACPYPVDDVLRTEPRLHQTFTLLFLEEKDDILDGIDEEEDTSLESKQLLYRFVEACNPTVTFEDLCRDLRLDIDSVSKLAHHFISARKARAIPPLRPGDTYIVSPNADLRKVQFHAPFFKARFPEAYGLARMLSMLSGKPRMYSSIMQPDRGPMYMKILEWLLRHGYVTQLRTYGMVKVGGKIRRAVHASHPELLDPLTNLGDKLVPLSLSDQTEDEKLLIRRMVRLRNKALRTIHNLPPSPTSGSDGEDEKEQEKEPEIEDMTASKSSDMTLRQYPPRKSYDDLSDDEISLHRPSLDSPPNRAITVTTYDSTWSNPTTTTILPTRGRCITPRDSGHTNSRPSSPPPDALPPSIYIANPSYPTLLEQEYLRALFASRDEEMRQYWERCKRYFDGREALEKVSVKEVDLERKDVRKMVTFLKLLEGESGGVGIWRGW